MEKFAILRGFRNHESSKAWSEALQNGILLFSDQQIVTGTAILIGAYAQVACGLQVYHWQIGVDLALVSSITHLTTITSLRRYFQGRRALRLWRLVWMSIIEVMLGVALGTKGYQLGAPSMPAWCLYHTDLMVAYHLIGPDGTNSSNSYDWLYMAILLGYLTTSYTSRALRLFPSLSDKGPTGLRNHLENGFRRRLRSLRERALRDSSLSWVLFHNSFLSLYCLLKAVAEMYTSLL